MLDTSFKRPIGDAGNVASWPFPVRIERVDGAFAGPVVSGHFKSAQPFVDAGRRLVERGVLAITTSCGFLVRHQLQMHRELTVPVLTSTLTQFSQLQATLGVKRVAVLTIDKAALDASVRAAAGIPDDALLFALPRNSHFVSAILRGTVTLDVDTAQAEWLELATTSLRRHPDIGLWLLECANMPPYSAALTRATGLPVYDALTMGQELFTMASRKALP